MYYSINELTFSFGQSNTEFAVKSETNFTEIMLIKLGIMSIY